MTEQLAHIGIIGMGVMGTSIARNFARHGYTTAIWNLEPQRTHEVAQQYWEEGTFWAFEELGEFIGKLERPRKVMMMVTAGPAVDSVMESIAPFLQDGDVVIDGGNSFFEQTIARERLWRERGIHFMGVGVSGGEVGALEGPSIMPGGSEHAYAQVGPLLEDIAAHVDGQPCCARMGTDGAGHFVKMVHNGIEYADMQLIAEAYALMRTSGMEPAQIAEVFREWNHSPLQSYLIEITADILAHTDAETGKPIVDVILDEAEQKGTGRWTAQSALELGVPVPVIAEAVFARSLSGHSELRTAAQASLRGPRNRGDVWDGFIDDLREALYASKVVCYAQGLDQIRTAAIEFGWDTNLAEVASIWRDGCIIRAALLDRIRDEFAQHELASLLVAPSLVDHLTTHQSSWRRITATAIEFGIPAPAMCSALAYWDAARTPQLPAALVQAQRDYFGAHTYERRDKAGSFHILWSGDRSEVAQGR